jgi:GNAT superfamily N-acetyltransferase
MSASLFGGLGDVQACEERLINCWPSHQTVLVGDWLCRFASGYSGRANSACCFKPATALDAETLRHIECLYNAAGLVPSIRVSPLVRPAVIRMLEQDGYAAEDGAIGMIGDAFASEIPPVLRLEATPGPEWLEGACRWQSGAKRDVAALRGIVSNIRVPTRYATLLDRGEGAAYALVSVDRGMAEFGAVMVDPERRGRGLGRQLVSGMITWAHQAGARRIFLQVATENEAAKALYGALGFLPVYSTAYWRRKR